MSRISRAEHAIGAPIVDDAHVVESPKPSPAPTKAKSSVKPTESEESSE